MNIKSFKTACIIGLVLIITFMGLAMEQQNNIIQKQRQQIKNVDSKIDQIDEIDMEDNIHQMFVNLTEKEVNKEAYYIRNEILYYNDYTLEQAAYKALLYYNNAKKYRIHPYLALAIGLTESNCRHTVSGDYVESSAGAVGEFQLMPATARIYNVDRFVVEKNIEGGIHYLSDLIDGYDNVEQAVAHYNGGSKPQYKMVHYKETRDYVEDVMRIYNSMREKY